MAGITPAPPGGRCQQMAAAFWESPRPVAHSPGAGGGAEAAAGPHPATPSSRSPWRKMLNPAWSPNSGLKQIVRELWMEGAERGTPCSAQVCLFLHLNKGKRLATNIYLYRKQLTGLALSWAGGGGLCHSLVAVVSHPPIDTRGVAVWVQPRPRRDGGLSPAETRQNLGFLLLKSNFSFSGSKQ